VKDALLDIEIDPPLRERVAEMAAREHRSLAGQTLYLVEVGMRLLEKAPRAAPAPAPVFGLRDAAPGRAEAVHV